MRALYERDENSLSANRNSIDEDEASGRALSSTRTTVVFLSREDACSFPDTFMLSARELKDAGVPKRRIRRALDVHHAELRDRGVGALEEVSSDEDEDVLRDEGEGGADMHASAEEGSCGYTDFKYPKSIRVSMRHPAYKRYIRLTSAREKRRTLSLKSFFSRGLAPLVSGEATTHKPEAEQPKGLGGCYSKHRSYGIPCFRNAPRGAQNSS